MINLSLSKNTYDIKHNEKYITFIFHHDFIKLSIICDRIRIDAVDLSICSVKTDLRRVAVALREEIAVLRDMIAKKDVMPYVVICDVRIKKDREILIFYKYKYSYYTSYTDKYNTILTINDINF